MSLTPVFWHCSNSLFFMRRDALVASGCIHADAGAEQLHAAAGAGGLDHRGLDAAGLAELLGDRRGERIDGGRSDDADLVTRLGCTGQTTPVAASAKALARVLTFTRSLLQLSNGRAEARRAFEAPLSRPRGQWSSVSSATASPSYDCSMTSDDKVSILTIAVDLFRSCGLLGDGRDTHREGRPTAGLALDRRAGRWWRARMCLTIASPRPVPPSARLCATSTR